MASSFVLVVLTGLLFCPNILAQTKPSPPPPVAKATPVEKTELSEAEFESKLIRTIQQPQQWKLNAPAGFGLKLDLPRSPVRQSETFYDETLGNARMVMYVSMGDRATFLAGNIGMPYAISDEKLLREAYAEVVKEFATDPDFKFENPKDFYFGGKLGVELSATGKNRIVAARARVFTVGRSMYLLVAMPHEPEKGENVTKAAESVVSAEFDRFFSSAAVDHKPIQSGLNKAPSAFAGKFEGGKFISATFKFSIDLPENWIQVSSDDVEGLRQWGRDFLSANSDEKLPTSSKNKQNIATFASAPLGNEGLASISFNLALRVSGPDDDMRLAEVTESLVSKIATYEIVRKPTRIKAGAVPAVMLESRIKFSDRIQNQIIYYFRSNGAVIGMTVGYDNAEDRDKVLAAVESLKSDK